MYVYVCVRVCECVCERERERERARARESERTRECLCLCELAWQQNGLVYSASVGCLLVVLLHVILVLEWFSL